MFKNIFSTRTVGWQKFVQYIRMLYLGCFISVGSVNEIKPVDFLLCIDKGEKRKYTSHQKNKYWILTFFVLSAINQCFTKFFVLVFRLQVHYPPHVSLSSDKGELLEEGERVRFSCEASANPSQLSYAW